MEDTTNQESQVNEQTPEQPPGEATVQAFTPVAQPEGGVPQRRFPFWIIGLLLLFLAAFAGGLLLRTRKEQSANPSQPTPTLIPTETPVHREINPIATTSAYMNLEGYVASLSASIGGYQVENQAVAPPVLDLPLGFTEE